MHAHVAHILRSFDDTVVRELPLKFEDPGGRNSPISMRAKNNRTASLDLYVRSGAEPLLFGFDANRRVTF